MNNEIYPAYFLNLLANVAQLYDLQLNLEQVGNDDLFMELRHQDKILDEQINKYLKKIVKQNEKIIEQNEEIKKLLKKYGAVAKKLRQDSAKV